MKIKSILKENRPRERLIKYGPSKLSDEELLSIILRCGNKDISAIELSYEIINNFGGLHNLYDLTYSELSKIKGVKEGKASIIMASFELSKRALSHIKQTEKYDNPKSLYNLIKSQVLYDKTECLYAIFLDSKCHLIEYQLMSRGSYNSVIIPNQEIYKRAIKLSSSLVCIAHNHPSGDPTPSRNDITATTDLKKALELLGIMLIDHIIIGNNDYYSFHESNKI